VTQQKAASLPTNLRLSGGRDARLSSRLEGGASNLFSTETYIAVLTTVGIAAHLGLRYLTHASRLAWLTPLFVALSGGGVPILASLVRKLWARQFGSDLLAGISIISSILLGEYLVGAIIVLMLSGGAALEQFATRDVHRA
jgi:cation transport ATPase